jgi:predicted enzyme related to lactoylglutathione lyase
MGERKEYTPGTFSWADLATTDQEAAKAFYGGLFGWEADDRPAGEGVVYSMMRLGGEDVAAIGPQPQQQRDAGVPPAWNSYITVGSADDTAEAIAAAGGSVHAPPFDVLDVGRMAVVQDPAGAFFMIWEPRSSIGAGLVNAPGAMCWNELAAPDRAAAEEFYGRVFGWTFEDEDGMPENYGTIKNRDRDNGGIRAPDAGEPPNWLVYFGTDDVERTLARAEELGGTRVAGPVALPGGSFGVVRDPQGATFALFGGRFDP